MKPFKQKKVRNKLKTNRNFLYPHPLQYTRANKKLCSLINRRLMRPKNQYKKGRNLSTRNLSTDIRKTETYQPENKKKNKNN